MEDCEFLTKCPIFAKFKLEGAKSFWIQMYCQGPRQADCARRRLKSAGQPVPETLLPNGTHQDSLA